MNLKQRARLKLAKMLDIKFEEVKTETAELLIDGKVEVGVEVFMYDEKGDLTIPADGEYKYEDKILVVEGGIITEIKEEDKDTEDTKEVDVEMEDIEDVTQLARIEALEDQVKALVEIIKEITGAVDEVKENVEEVAEDVEAIDSEFKKVAGKSVKQPINKKTIKQSKKESLTDRFFGNK